jgi:hypothetical protein
MREACFGGPLSVFIARRSLVIFRVEHAIDLVIEHASNPHPLDVLSEAACLHRSRSRFETRSEKRILGKETSSV